MSSIRRPQPPSSAGVGASRAVAGDSGAAGFSLLRPSSTRASSTANRSAAAGAIGKVSRSSSDTGASPTIINGGGGGDPNSKWRSGTIHLEVALKELVSDGPSCPPSVERIERVLALYDEFASSTLNFTTILRLFRVEFCRAIFSSMSPTVGEVGQTPYFEKVDSILKDRAILQAELAAAEADSSVDELKRQIGKLQSLISFYEHEVGRLTRENKKANEEIARMANDIDVTVRQHQTAFATLDDEVHRLTKENRELQLQVFKLGKDSRDQVAGQSLYLTMKQTKFDSLQRMFERGNEEASLMLLLNQVEAQLNKVIDEFDTDLFKSSSAEIMSLRSRLVKKAGLLLEEYHHIQARFGAVRRIASSPHQTGGSGGGGTQASSTGLPVTLLESGDNMLREFERGALHRAAGISGGTDVVAAGAKRSGATSPTVAAAAKPPSPSPGSAPLQGSGAAAIAGGTATSAAGPDAATEAAAQRRRWAETILRPRLGSKIPQHRDTHHHEPVIPGRVMHRELLAPLLDVSNSKFMTSIEVHTQAGGESTFLRNVTYVDPSSGIELPPRATHVKIKFANPMMRPAVRSLVSMEEKARLEEEGAGYNVATADDVRVGAVLDWMPGKEDTSQASPSAGGGGARVVSVSSNSGFAEPDFDAAHWAAFRRTFLNYRPHLPRFLDIHHIDFVMVQTFQHHSAKLLSRFDHCNDVAMQRSTGTQMAKMLAERFFRDEHRPHELQLSLLEVLEARYVFPEIVMKVAYEVLFGLERCANAYPYAKTYLSCLAGTTPPSSGYLIALNLHQLSSFWPLSTAQLDAPITERDLAAVLRCLYPAESNAVKISTEEVLNDMVISCRKHLSLRKVKEHTSLAILGLKEPICAKFLDMLMFRASAVHWAELDHGDFWETTRHILLEDKYQAALVKFLNCAAVLQKTTRVPPADLAHIAAEIIWVRDGATV